MAEYNQLLEQRYNRLLRGKLGLEEQDGISAVGPELVPVIELESDRYEDGFLRDEHYCSGIINIVATGANLAHAALTNPVGSGILATLTDFYISSSVADTITLRRRDTVLANSAGNSLRLDRRSPSPIATCLISQQDVANLGGNVLDFFRIPAGVELHRYSVSGGLSVLPPGTGVMVIGGTALENLVITFRWRERRVRPGELG